MMNIVSARPGGAAHCLLQEAARRLGADDKPVYVVVPKQLTLQTELELIRALEPGGSFRINVLSPERLCARIFEAAGAPEFTRVDDRGRVMLARRVLNQCRDGLKVYSGAGHRRGFPARSARQLELFRQAGLDADALSALAEGEKGLLGAKLYDMALIIREYDALIRDRYMDGEAEFMSAAQRASQADIARCGMIFYGFDVMPRPLHELMARLGTQGEVTAIFAADGDGRAPDADAFLAVNRSIGRLRAVCAENGCQTAMVRGDMPDRQRPAALRHLEKRLFAAKSEPYEGDMAGVRLFAMKDPRAEAARVAARCRELAMNGARWNDMMVVCPDMGAYSRALINAFEACGVPLFTSSSRPASRHALAEALMSALRLIWKGFRTEDALALLRTGYAGCENTDVFANYLIKYAPRGRALCEPFTRGDDAEAAETARACLMGPVLELRGAIRQAEDLKGQLTAIFGYLTSIGAYETSLKRQEELVQGGLYHLAGEESQVWNRILTTLDQMAALMGEKRLSYEDLAETLTEALDSAVIKPLPQAGDAVYAQGLDQAVQRSAAYIFVLGLTDRVYSGCDGLFADSQLNHISRKANRYLGPDGAERALMRRYYIKTALCAAEKAVEISYPISAEDGAAQRPGAVIAEIKRLLPHMREQGGIEGELADALAAPAAAVRSLGAHMDSAAGRGALSTLAAERTPQVERLLRAFDLAHVSEQLRTDTVKKLYGALSSASVTRLELFGRCPFAHFMRYALSPQRTEPYELTVRDEGGFFHDAVRSFLAGSMGDAGEIDMETADRRMDEVSDVLLDGMAGAELFDTAVSRAQKRRLRATARAAAEALVGQLAGSEFSPVELELEFGRDDGAALRLSTEGAPCALEGRVDRIDEWKAPSDDFLRVIDYKRGNTELRLCEAYYGLQLQLIVYLAAAMRRRGAVGAGVYYFKIDEGIVSDQSTDPAEIASRRRAAMKLNGLTVAETEVVSAMAPEPGDVISIRINKDGRISRSSSALERSDFELVIARTLENAARHVDSIRAGSAQASPARTRKLDPCRYCDYRKACLFDESLSAARVRRMEDMKNDEVVERLRSESEK
jgi:ATP-dependent helicase/nuclease subunit B